MSNMFERTIGLIGEDKFLKIQNATIAVIGLGGVGGTALEALARSGFKNFVIVDFDKVSDNNLNRQILYKHDDIGKYKVDIAKEHLLSINSDCNILSFNMKINENNISQIKADFVVDAIDDVDGKIAIAKYCQANSIPFIVSLGMANRLDPSLVSITKLNKTTADPLAKKIRYEFKKNNIDVSSISCAFSSEIPIKDTNKLHSMMMVPSSAGLNISNYVLNYYLN